jgi:hypothetical protein
MSKLWDRIISLLIKLIPPSVILAITVWKMMGKDLDLNAGESLNIDFFNTLCGSFTIVGFIIAIYQLADINTRQEDIDEALHKMKKIEAIGRITKCKEEIDDFKQHVRSSNFLQVSKNMSELKDELHKAKEVCPQKEPEISRILQRVNTLSGSVNREDATPSNSIDKDSMFSLFSK